MFDRFFQKIQVNGIMPAGSTALPRGTGDVSEHQRHMRFFTVFSSTLLILAVIAALMFLRSTSGHPNDNKIPQARSSTAPLDLYP